MTDLNWSEFDIFEMILVNLHRVISENMVWNIDTNSYIVTDENKIKTNCMLVKRKQCYNIEAILMIKQQKSFQKCVTGKSYVNSVFCKNNLLVITLTCIKQSHSVATTALS